jgi:hypothetical protein
MKHSCLYSRTLGKVGFSLFSIAVLSVALTAQTTEVQIMVAGPWDYVQDPNDQNRVIVVVPAAPHHARPQIFPGGDVTNYPNQPALEQGLYRVDICDQANNNCSFPQQPVKPCTNCKPYRPAKQVLDVDINAYLSHTNRYAISLPKPYEYTTSPDPDGLSQSIISDKPITDTGVVPDPLAGDYTTWMVLHYQVTGNPVALLSGTSDDGTVTYKNKPSAFVGASGTPAISIIQEPADRLNDKWCDKYSAESFHHANMNWKLNLYALFPELTGIQGEKQYRDHFHYTCPQTVTSQGSADLRSSRDYRKMLNALLLVSNFFAGAKDVNRKDALAGLDAASKSMNALSMRFGSQDSLDKIMKFFSFLQELVERKKEARNLSADDKSKLFEILIQLHSEMAGATDCRKAQMSINGIIP